MLESVTPKNSGQGPKAEARGLKAQPFLTLTGPLSSREDRGIAGRQRIPCLTSCSDDSKLYMVLKALDESYKNHIGFAIVRASFIHSFIHSFRPITGRRGHQSSEQPAVGAHVTMQGTEDGTGTLVHMKK